MTSKAPPSGSAPSPQKQRTRAAKRSPTPSPPAPRPRPAPERRVGRLHSLLSVRRELAQLYREMRSGAVEPKTGSKLCYVLVSIGQVLQAEQNPLAAEPGIRWIVEAPRPLQSAEEWEARFAERRGSRSGSPSAPEPKTQRDEVFPL